MVEEIARNRALLGTLTNGILRQEILLKPDKSGEKILDYATQPIDNGQQILVDAPGYRFYLKSWDPTYLPDLDLLTPFVEALAYFDSGSIRQLLDFGQNSIRREMQIGGSLLTKLRPLIATNRWLVEVMAFNAGSRVAIISPFAVLKGRRVHGRDDAQASPYCDISEAYA